MLQRIIAFSLAGMVLAAGSAFAGEPACSECPIQQAMKNLPAIAYVVGEEECHCSNSAQALATEKGLDVRFAVGEETFDNESDAKIALVSATEKMVEEFATPHVCSKSGNTTIAGQTTHCSKTAAKFANLISESMKTIQLSYKVGDEECNCPNHAASLAKSTGEPKLFVVGEECTSCETTARLNLARAKYRAAVEALVKAKQSAAAQTVEVVTES